MPFRVRNTFHLRLSVDEVIPLCVYLDDRHVGWMSKRILKSVVSDLRTLIQPKLNAEKNAHLGPGGPANVKKGTVDVHRGGSYQFAYFLRKAEPHTLLLKTRNFVINEISGIDDGDSSRAELKSSGKRKFEEGSDASQEDINQIGRKPQKRTATGANRRQEFQKDRRRNTVNANSTNAEDEIEMSSIANVSSRSERYSSAPRRSTRSRKQVQYLEELEEGSLSENVDDGDGGDYNLNSKRGREDKESRIKQEEVENQVFDDSGTESDVEPSASTRTKSVFDVDEDEEDEVKKKPTLQLSFRELKMLDRCLSVVIEPWATRGVTPAQSSRSSIPRTGSMAPPPHPSVTRRESDAYFSRASIESLESGREQTPLFLPDHDERERDATPAPMRFTSVFSSLETFSERETLEFGEDDFGMLAFSQALNSVAGDRIGAVDDDDEMDGGALYGDADEMRESFM